MKGGRKGEKGSRSGSGSGSFDLYGFKGLSGIGTTEGLGLAVYSGTKGGMKGMNGGQSGLIIGPDGFRGIDGIGYGIYGSSSSSG